MPRTDPRNEREANRHLAETADRPPLALKSRLDARHASAHAAASIARHRRFKARLARFAGTLAWLALCAILGAALAHFLARA